MSYPQFMPHLLSVQLQLHHLTSWYVYTRFNMNRSHDFQNCRLLIICISVSEEKREIQRASLALISLPTWLQCVGLTQTDTYPGQDSGTQSRSPSWMTGIHLLGPALMCVGRMCVGRELESGARGRIRPRCSKSACGSPGFVSFFNTQYFATHFQMICSISHQQLYSSELLS